jgi:hypothetical protein
MNQVLIADLELAASLEHDRLRTSRSGQFSSEYHDYEAIVEHLQMLADAYASNAQFIPDIGRSLEDRAVSAIRIGDGSKPVVWFQCGIHAREWISPAAW